MTITWVYQLDGKTITKETTKVRGKGPFSVDKGYAGHTFLCTRPSNPKEDGMYILIARANGENFTIIE